MAATETSAVRNVKTCMLFSLSRRLGVQEGSDLECPKRVTQAINTAFDNVDTYLKTVCSFSCLFNVGGWSQ